MEGISLSIWREGNSSKAIGLEDDWDEGVAWFSVEPDVEYSSEIRAYLQKRCRGLSENDLRDIFRPDPVQSNEEVGGVDRVFTFQISFHPDIDAEDLLSYDGHIGTLIFDPIEICAGDGWMITKRHDSFRIEGEREVREDAASDISEAVERLERIWVEHEGKTASDLATMLMISFSIEYERAYRHLRYWTEDWELRLYRDPGSVSDDDLVHVWQCMVRLRSWLRILRIRDLIYGESVDASRAWFPKARETEILEVNKHISETFTKLVNLADILRTAFQSYYLEQEKLESLKQDTFRRRAEIGAVLFIVPALIVGIAGSNTWVPGRDSVAGFLIMLLLMVLSTLLTLSVLGLLRKSKS